MKKHPEHKNLLQFNIFDRYRQIEHFSSTRSGGVSKGEFRSLNLGNYSDDDPLKIYENRSILAQKFYLESEDFVTPHQTHGSEIIVIDKEFIRLQNSEKVEKLYGIDASVTQEHGFFLCVTTADCVPILLFDKRKQIIAAIHAGWRGTANRIVEKTILKMQDLYRSDARDIIAAIGPAIGVQHYEVGKLVEEEFQKNGYKLDAFVSFRNKSSKKLHIDLKEINQQELIRLGVPKLQIEKTRYCTYKNSRLFFSARRQSVHSGRMLTGIMLK